MLTDNDWNDDDDSSSNIPKSYDDHKNINNDNINNN